MADWIWVVVIIGAGIVATILILFGILISASQGDDEIEADYPETFEGGGSYETWRRRAERSQQRSSTRRNQTKE